MTRVLVTGGCGFIGTKLGGRFMVRGEMQSRSGAR